MYIFCIYTLQGWLHVCMYMHGLHAAPTLFYCHVHASTIHTKGSTNQVSHKFSALHERVHFQWLNPFLRLCVELGVNICRYCQVPGTQEDGDQTRSCAWAWTVRISCSSHRLHADISVLALISSHLDAHVTQKNRSCRWDAVFTVLRFRYTSRRRRMSTSGPLSHLKCHLCRSKTWRTYSVLKTAI